MQITDDQINSIVNRVVSKIAPTASKQNEPVVNTNPTNTNNNSKLVSTTTLSNQNDFHGSLGSFTDINVAINAAERAYWELKKVSVAKRKQMIEAIRQICTENIEELSRRGVEETTYGRFEDKIVKNRLAITKTPGVEDLEPIAFSGDNGLTLFERAPFGIIGSITPSTNPTETIISNGIGMIAGGNTVVFNPHPAAKNVSVFTINLLNKAILSAGGPPNLLTTVTNPTIESAKILMTHPKINLLVVTGGPGVVAQAMKSGKKVVAAGPGNPPVVVDETADLEQAAKDIVISAGTDNNIICIIEKNIIALEGIADKFKKLLVKHGAVELSSYQARRLEKIIVNGEHPNKKWVGQTVQKILKQIGMDVDPSKRIAIYDTNKDHPFAKIELLMPVLPFIKAKTFSQAVDIAYEVEGGCFHTSAIHSKNIDHMQEMAVKMNTSIFVKNGQCLAGIGLNGEGPASFTIASPTGEGVTTARHFTRTRRCVIKGHFRIV